MIICYPIETDYYKMCHTLAVRMLYVSRKKWVENVEKSTIAIANGIKCKSGNISVCFTNIQINTLSRADTHSLLLMKLKPSPTIDTTDTCRSIRMCEIVQRLSRRKNDFFFFVSRIFRFAFYISCASSIYLWKRWLWFWVLAHIESRVALWQLMNE